MADLLSETVITLATAARMFPGNRGGKSLNPSTVFRWVTRGEKSPNGLRVKLEAVRAGGRWLTTVEAVRRFCEKLTPPSADRSLPPSVRSPSERRKASERAEAELIRKGV